MRNLKGALLDCVRIYKIFTLSWRSHSFSKKNKNSIFSATAVALVVRNLKGALPLLKGDKNERKNTNHRRQ